MTDREYQALAQRRAKPSPIGKDCLNAFWIGGLICALGQLLLNWFGSMGLEKEDAGTAVSVALVLLSALATGFSLYDDLAKVAGAGTLVPITGFANSVVAPSIEFSSEGIITGTCVKAFSIAGPVIVIGTAASVAYGLVYWLLGLL